MEHASEVPGMQTDTEDVWESKHVTDKGLRGLGAKALSGSPREMP